MLTKKFTTISIASLATLGAFAMSAEQAAAGFRGHGHGVRISFHGGHGHRHWGHRHHWGFYRAPVYVSSPYVSCYYVRRGGGLFKVCPVY